MIEELFHSARVRHRMAASELGIIIHRFVLDLHARGHALGSIQSYAQIAEHFSRWLAQQHFSLRQIDDTVVERFLREHLPHCRCSKPAPTHARNCRAALGRLLIFLRAQGLIPDHKPVRPSPVGRLVQLYERHLEEVGGLAASTRRARSRYACEFLQTRVRARRVSLRNLSATDLTRYIHRRAPGLKPTSLRALTVALRDLMRFLHFRGQVAEACIAGVPRPAPWPRQQLPEVFQPEELKVFLRSFDRTTGTGRRDYAMALGLTQLGLRVQEVAQLRLDDLDWRQSALRLRQTKQRRDRCLPLNGRLAGAIASYLRCGRPRTASPALFVRHRAPLGEGLEAHHVRGAMRRALARSGLKTSRLHLFRHTFATQLHRRGVGLKAIADFLGHQCLDTTAQYARVNLRELRQAALPWPERWR
jgi:site-specific recombinase XerD